MVASGTMSAGDVQALHLRLELLFFSSVAGYALRVERWSLSIKVGCRRYTVRWNYAASESGSAKADLIWIYRHPQAEQQSSSITFDEIRRISEVT